MNVSTKVPGVKAQHAIISDACRQTWGDFLAFEIAVERLRETYQELTAGWELGKGAQIHLAITLERPAHQERPQPECTGDAKG